MSDAETTAKATSEIVKLRRRCPWMRQMTDYDGVNQELTEALDRLKEALSRHDAICDEVDRLKARTAQFDFIGKSQAKGDE